jgi:hypothetical protein
VIASITKGDSVVMELGRAMAGKRPTVTEKMCPLLLAKARWGIFGTVSENNLLGNIILKTLQCF